MSKRISKAAGKTLAVKYDNKLNTLQFTNFTKRENIITFFILAYLRDIGEETIFIPFSEFRVFIPGLRHKSNKELAEMLRGKNKEEITINAGEEENGFLGKLNRLNCRLLLDDGAYFVSLFDTLYVPSDETGMYAQINKKFAWILNGAKAYTLFDFVEFALFQTKYSLALYRLLKQWKATGYVKYSLEELRYYMDIPSSVPSRNILSKYVTPAVDEIMKKTATMKNIKVKRITQGKEHRVAYVEISFETTSEHPLLSDSGKSDVLYSLGKQELNREDLDWMLDRHEKKTVEKTIQRILQKPYYGMLTKETIDQWCAEEEKALGTKTEKTKNTFHNFDQREYDFEALEQKLFHPSIKGAPK